MQLPFNTCPVNLNSLFVNSPTYFASSAILFYGFNNHHRRLHNCHLMRVFAEHFPGTPSLNFRTHPLMYICPNQLHCYCTPVTAAPLFSTFSPQHSSSICPHPPPPPPLCPSCSHLRYYTICMIKSACHLGPKLSPCISLTLCVTNATITSIILLLLAVSPHPHSTTSTTSTTTDTPTSPNTPLLSTYTPIWGISGVAPTPLHLHHWHPYLLQHPSPIYFPPSEASQVLKHTQLSPGRPNQPVTHLPSQPASQPAIAS